MPRRDRVTENQIAENNAFVDTSAWIALLSRRDQNHEDADRMFRAAIASNCRLLTTNLILAEVHRLLLHRAGVRASGAALQKIEESHRVHIEFPGITQHKSAKAWIEKLHDYPISYTAAVSFALMESIGCTVAITFDHHFALAGFLRI